MLVKDVVKTVVDQIAPGVRYNRFLKINTAKEPETALLALLCEPGALAIDVGANQGLYVHHLLGVTDRVVAFEPLPQMQAILRRMYGTRIRLEPVALSSAPGATEIKFPEGHYPLATLERTNTFDGSLRRKIVTTKTEIRTLDSYAFRDVGLIKIDVEGHEEAVLKGALETLSGSRPSLIIEIEERHKLGAVQRIHDMLRSVDYAGFFLADGAISRIEAFSIARDQSFENVGLNGKLGRYINNFIFVPQQGAAAFEQAAGRLPARMH